LFAEFSSEDLPNLSFAVLQLARANRGSFCG
jgi:hypothetical protein